MFDVERKISAAARKGALYSASAVLLLLGAAFLTAAAWLVLAELKSTLFAATVIGAVYFGLGCLGIVIASASTRPSPAPKPPEEAIDGLSPIQMVVVSFLQGIERGAQAKRDTQSKRT